MKSVNDSHFVPNYWGWWLGFISHIFHIYVTIMRKFLKYLRTSSLVLKYTKALERPRKSYILSLTKLPSTHVWSSNMQTQNVHNKYKARQRPFFFFNTFCLIFPLSVVVILQNFSNNFFSWPGLNLGPVSLVEFLPGIYNVYEFLDIM